MQGAVNLNAEFSAAPKESMPEVIPIVYCISLVLIITMNLDVNSSTAPAVLCYL